jgi:hypothetical protein
MAASKKKAKLEMVTGFLSSDDVPVFAASVCIPGLPLEFLTMVDSSVEKLDVIARKHGSTVVTMLQWYMAAVTMGAIVPPPSLLRSNSAAYGTAKRTISKTKTRKR